MTPTAPNDANDPVRTYRIIVVDDDPSLLGRLRRMLGEAYEVHTASSAAFNDPRFPAVASIELAELVVEISALTPIERTDDPLAIRLGTDGVYVTDASGSRNGCYLPQVGEHFGGEVKRFLESVCRDKAKLSKDAWQEEGTQIYLFQADVFSEA